MPAVVQSPAGFFRRARLILCLLLAPAPFLNAASAEVSAIGGTTLSAGLADSRLQLNQAMGAGAGTDGADSLAQFADAYRASGGGPTLAFLGFNPFQIVATGAFHALFWSVVVIFLGIMTLVAMQQALRGRYALSARNPLVLIAQVYFRLMVGVLIISNTPLVYALIMMLNSVLSQGVQAMSTQSMANLFQTGSMGTLTFAQARIEAIRSAAARRAVALYPSGASRDEMVQVGNWYNAMAGAINADLSAQNLPGQLPLLTTATWTNAQTPDDQVAASIGRVVVQNFGQMLADLGALPAASGPLSISFPSGGATSLALLSAALAGDDAQVAQAMILPNTPSSNSSFEAARQLYAKNVLADTLNYLDTQLLSVVSASPTLIRRAQAWFSEKVEQAAAAAGGFMTEWRAAVDWIGRGIGVVLTRMVAFFFTAAIGALIEIELFMLVLAMPLWLLPATEGAFYGVMRSLVSLGVAVPAYQFIMLFVDALMGLVLKYVMFGPLAGGQTGVLPTVGGIATLVAAAVAAVGSGGEIVVLVMFCYMIAYLFLAVYVAIKTPRIIAVFLKGTGAAGAFLSTFATGLIAGAATAVATAAVAGGGVGGLAAGRLLGANSGGNLPPGHRTGDPPSAFRDVSSQGPGPARTAGGPASFRPPPGRPASAPLPAEKDLPRGTSLLPGNSPSPLNPKAVEAAGFGLRTFTDCLRADSPADGFKIAMHALDNHRKQKEKEAEARHKTRLSAAKPGAARSPRP